jgi:hypothetical protein
MGVIEQKASAINAKVTGGAASADALAPAPGGILAMIIALLKSLMGGLGICNPPTPGPTPTPVPPAVHEAITNPTPWHQRVLEHTTYREVRRARLPSSMELPIIEATLAVGAACSQADTDALWRESRGA